ncbi:MAG: dicarboxylate/amino acid:cation symporter, partial [Gemmatimonadaceae bacterium]
GTPVSAPGGLGSSRTLTAGALIGVAAGLLAGTAVHLSGSEALAQLTSVVEPVGTVWVRALRMCVIPLVVPLLIVGIASSEDARAAGKLGGLSILIFLALLGTAAAFTLLVALPLLKGGVVTPASLRSLREQLRGTAVSEPAPRAESFTDWLTGIVPANPVSAAAGDDILPLIVFTLLFALALARTAPARREAVVGFCRAVTETMLVLVRWVLLLAPVGVFALAFPLAVRTGLGAAGILGAWVLLVCGLLLGFTAILYPIATLVGGVPLRRFAAAVAPAQVVAVSSRSSLASLPSLIDGAERRLGLPPAITGLALPLAVSTFKVNRTISSTVKFLFLATLYGIPLEATNIATFVLSVTLLSFSSPGLPSTGTLVTLPVYVAAGIPVEGALLLQAVDSIPDIFKTLVNVTADLTAATILARIAGVQGAIAAPASALGAPAIRPAEAPTE